MTEPTYTLTQAQLDMLVSGLERYQVKRQDFERFLSELEMLRSLTPNSEGHALLEVLAALQEYLPPDGIGANECISKMLSIVDPWPVGLSHPAPSFERLPKEYEKILHDNAWDLYETGSAEPASSTNDVKQETSEWLSEEYGAAPSTAGERAWKGLTDPERDNLVGDLVDYGTETVAPLYSVIEQIERNLKDRNTALLQSTALPDHSEQHLDMVAAQPVGESRPGQHCP